MIFGRYLSDEFDVKTVRLLGLSEILMLNGAIILSVFFLFASEMYGKEMYVAVYLKFGVIIDIINILFYPFIKMERKFIFNQDDACFF